MDMEETFLKAIREKPGDAATRLIYADWLEEQGDIRAEYIRLQQEIASADWNEAERIRDQLRQIRTTLSPDWWTQVSTTAVLSNIHSNWPALRAVIDDATRLGAERFVCLGNVTSAGPNPVECCRWVCKNCDWWLTGFWDYCLPDPLQRAISSATHRNETSIWNRDLLLQDAEGESYILQLSSGNHCCREGSVLFVYGSVRNPENGAIPESFYVGKDSFEDPGMPHEYEALPGGIRLCFVGRWGFPCIAWPNGTIDHEHHFPEKINVTSSGHPLIANVGSVGLPQDRDPRACYVLLSGEGFAFRRVEYEVEEVIAAFAGAKELSRECREWMIQRHREGV